jgi:hypothetical protein
LPRPAEIVRVRSTACRRAAPAISAIAAGEPEGVDPAAQIHVAQCLRCQAEVVAYRKLLRTLRAMRREAQVPPAGSIGALLLALDEAADRAGSSAGWALRAAYLGGLTAAAGAAGVLVWMNRRRPGYAQAG